MSARDMSVRVVLVMLGNRGGFQCGWGPLLEDNPYAKAGVPTEVTVAVVARIPLTVNRQLFVCVVVVKETLGSLMGCYVQDPANLFHQR